MNNKAWQYDYNQDKKVYVNMFIFSHPSGAVPRGSAKSKYLCILTEEDTLIVKKIHFPFFTGENITDWTEIPVLFTVKNYQGEMTGKAIKKLERKYAHPQ